ALLLPPLRLLNLTYQMFYFLSTCPFRQLSLTLALSYFLGPDSLTFTPTSQDTSLSGASTVM
ncbi:hypothetical protein, partial [Klebsiella pneumoniae]|uniref:hypothetical protein n=1 Tax=Klebsiella pneumoniae TaxID=573 RepID=UPI001F4B891D